MNIWFTSDLHFNHKNILRFCPTRLGDDVGAMNEAIIAQWNSQVAKGDTVYHLGDFLFGNRNSYNSAFCDIVNKLKGNIKFIYGNHDTYMQQVKVDTSLERVEFLGNYHEREFSVNQEKVFLVMCHYPFASWNRKSYGSINLHGHCHGTYSSQRLNRQADVGWDSADLGERNCLHNLNDIVAQLKKESSDASVWVQM